MDVRRKVDPLCDLVCRTAKPRLKAYKITDGQVKCLHLNVTPGGTKSWRMNYLFKERWNTLSFGIYPEVGLGDARAKAEAARKMLRAGVDPQAVKKEQKARAKAADKASADTLEAVAREWVAVKGASWSGDYAESTVRRLERFVFPTLGWRKISELEPPDILACLRAVKSANTAARALMAVGQAFRFAVACGKAKSDPTRDLRGALKQHVGKHRPRLTDERAIGEMLRKMDTYAGSPATVAALRLLPLLALRQENHCGLRWAWVNLAGAEIRVPKAAIKHRRSRPVEGVLIVPLSRQAAEILEGILPLTGRGEFVFPSTAAAGRPLGDSTLGKALEKLGYPGDVMTVHGFRGIFRTLLEERGYPKAHVETQLFHKYQTYVEAAYNQAEFLKQRRELMQKWADILDDLKRG